MTEPVISLKGVSKRYWQIKERSLLRSLVPIGGPNRSELWALRDIDLEIGKGETVGIVGRNGAGKSTLLRLLAGVSQPSAGRLTIRGRIAPLLSVGVGFHQEMTGRENVFVNGMLLGLTRPQIRAMFDRIVAFADLADFIDTPVKFYSTGMFMRLGFSVAIHVAPDVLIVDEVLAVGDIAFQLRCINRMRELQQSGTTIVFVSHSMHAVHLLCPRTVVVHRGQIAYDGPTETAIARYHQLLASGDEHNPAAGVRVLSRELVLADGTPVDDVTQDQTLTYRLVLGFDQPVDGPGIVFRVLGEDGTLAYSMQTPIGEVWRKYLAGEEAAVAIEFRPRLGGGGTFHINVDVTDSGSVVLVSDPNGPSFFVPPRHGVAGPAELEATIVIDGEHRTNHSWSRLEDVPPPSG
ncbi:MAG: polysaccharide ABC transporter ATP-binding protein [Actinomycetota bacterium]|nr:polysaccharide ABC transporter ATP-binding protein [Actinomycetota bacterium]